MKIDINIAFETLIEIFNHHYNFVVKQPLVQNNVVSPYYVIKHNFCKIGMQNYTTISKWKHCMLATDKKTN